MGIGLERRVNHSLPCQKTYPCEGDGGGCTEHHSISRDSPCVKPNAFGDT